MEEGWAFLNCGDSGEGILNHTFVLEGVVDLDKCEVLGWIGFLWHIDRSECGSIDRYVCVGKGVVHCQYKGWQGEGFFDGVIFEDICGLRNISC